MPMLVIFPPIMYIVVLCTVLLYYAFLHDPEKMSFLSNVYKL